MTIELILGLGLIFTLALLIVYVTSSRARRLKWEAMDSRLKKFKRKGGAPVTKEDRKYLEKYASLGAMEFGPPDSEGRMVARLAR